MCSPTMLTRPGALKDLERGDEMATVCHHAVRDADGDDVEAQDVGSASFALQVLEGEPPEPPPLRRGDGLLGEAEGRGRAGLDLAEDERALELGDDVELAAADAVVPMQDPVAGFRELGGGGLLAKGPRDLPCPRHEQDNRSRQ